MNTKVGIQTNKANLMFIQIEHGLPDQSQCVPSWPGLEDHVGFNTDRWPGLEDHVGFNTDYIWRFT
jgi:hypothetical protein